MNKIRKFKTSIYTFVILILIKTSNVIAAVTVNQTQAQADIKSITDPVSSLLLYAALPITGISIGWAYATWSGKDEEEKEQMPFVKSVKKHIIAFVIFGLSGAALKWFSIS